MSDNITQWITEIAFHQLWLGALLAAVVWLAARWRRAWNAESRYWVWSGALAVIALLPLFMWVPKGQVQAIPGSATPASVSTFIREALSIDIPAPGSRAAPNAEAADAAPTSRTIVPSIAMILVAVWIAGMAWRSVALLRGLATLRRWRLSAAAVNIDSLASRVVGLDCCEIRESANVPSPMVVGVFRPCILIPLHLREKLDDAQMALVLSHELAHTAARPAARHMRAR